MIKQHGWLKNVMQSFLMRNEVPSYKIVVENMFDKFQNLATVETSRILSYDHIKGFFSLEKSSL